MSKINWKPYMKMKNNKHSSQNFFYLKKDKELIETLIPKLQTHIVKSL